LWANIKLRQRKALTAEKQARLATGGGPEHSVAQTDPEVLAFTSNDECTRYIHIEYARHCCYQ